MCFCLVLGGCAFRQNSYDLANLGWPVRGCFDTYPALWWINYAHTITQFVSIHLMIMASTGIVGADGGGSRPLKSRLIPKALGDQGRG